MNNRFCRARTIVYASDGTAVAANATANRTHASDVAAASAAPDNRPAEATGGITTEAHAPTECRHVSIWRLSAAFGFDGRVVTYDALVRACR